MAKDIMETVKRKMKEGWIKAWLAVEVLAVTEDAAETALQKHVEKMEKAEIAIIYKKEFKETKQVSNPFDKKGHAYSRVVEIELVARRFENLLFLVMNYAPSSIEILEPGKISMQLGEAQGILNSVSGLIHNFVAASKGGLVIDA